MQQIKIFTYIVGSVQTNCYLVIDDQNNAVMIDPGDDAKRLMSKIDDKSCVLKKILLTHPHFDHIMAVNDIAAKYEVPVVIHTADAEVLYNPILNYYKGIKLDDRVTLEQVGDGDTVTAGNMNFKVLHTPGHTKGSSCFIIGGDIFTGDTLFRGDVGRTDLYGGDDAELDRSLKKLRELDGEYKVWSGHGASSTLERERTANPYM